MLPLKIGIIGSRGIPNCYGGFEQLAQFLAEGLVRIGHQVSVYNPHNHPYRKNEWMGVKIVHCYDAAELLGAAGHFFYDLNCIRHAGRNKIDVILFLGYTSSSVWRRFFPRSAVIISNMDGMEWKRVKYSKPVRRFLQFAEKLAVRHSDFLVADSEVIQQYLKERYQAESRFIPYGAVSGAAVKEELLEGFGLKSKQYFMLMARIEPENNIEMILEGFHRSNLAHKFIVIGNFKNSFGRRMWKKFEGDKRISFAGAIYDKGITHTLRAFCSMYFHGHSVGGTNPSLLEAMADGALIAAHDNAFNREVLDRDAYYFTSFTDVQGLVESITVFPPSSMVENNLFKITCKYNWPAVIGQYDEFITGCYKLSQR